MTSLLKKFILSFSLIISVSSGSCLKAQVLKDTATFNLMCKGVDNIYNLEFSQARNIFQKISKSYPDHPIVYVYKGLITYWENYPLIPTSPERALFEKNMFNAIELCEKSKENDYEAEYLLSNIGARGLLLLFYADNGLTRDVMSVASSTYQYVKESFNYTKTYADFYFITGLYNYYREAYPEAHPVYKPVALLFPKGDKVRGLNELQIASKNAVVLKAEAYTFLSGIYISYENNFQQAYQYSKTLHKLYPNNVQYLATYIKNLILVKNYSEAESEIKSGRSLSDNGYFQAQLNILNGIIYEKKYQSFRQAQYYYGKGIKDLSPFGTIGDEFTAYGYFGLSRMSQDKHQKKEYRKLAMEMADYKNVNFDK